ncbi:hypothetical protein OQI87_10715 [Lactobacillus kefiranofaciens]|uniref:hypothetical protein n=1 Tax=Lactobacillus kefiranofaciens TaxID=267818 RepID=UPI00246960C2|nr:hypothetical protein [Lactobacillus kefiranofaciens]MDH5101480.1 hypothetical protein [Lactobacillus kefiranofaciens]
MVGIVRNARITFSSKQEFEALRRIANHTSRVSMKDLKKKVKEDGIVIQAYPPCLSKNE